MSQVCDSRDMWVYVLAGRSGLSRCGSSTFLPRLGSATRWQPAATNRALSLESCWKRGKEWGRLG